MAKETIQKIDVRNQSTRDYRSPSGILVPGGQTTSLPKEEGESMLKSYPKDLISPDALRSSPASQSDADRRKEIDRLQGVIEDLKGKLAESVREVTGLKAKTEQHPLKVAFGALGELLTNEAHKAELEADEGLRSGVLMFHEFLDEHFKKKAAETPETPKV